MIDYQSKERYWAGRASLSPQVSPNPRTGLLQLRPHTPRSRKRRYKAFLFKKRAESGGDIKPHRTLMSRFLWTFKTDLQYARCDDIAESLDFSLIQQNYFLISARFLWRALKYNIVVIWQNAKVLPIALYLNMGRGLVSFNDWPPRKPFNANRPRIIFSADLK